MKGLSMCSFQSYLLISVGIRDLRIDSGGGRVGGGRLHVLVAQNLCRELSLCFGQRRTRWPVDPVHLGHKHNVNYNTRDESNGDQHCNHSNCYIFFKCSNTRNQSTKASTTESNWLDNRYDNLKQEYEEEHHEIEGRVTSERLVDGPVPADEAERCEQQEI